MNAYREEFRKAYSQVRPDLIVTLQELLTFCNSMSNNMMDPIFVKEIWENMTKQRDGTSNIDNFFETYLEAEKVLLQQQQEASHLLDILRTQLKELELNYEEALDEENKPKSAFYKNQPSNGKVQLQVGEITGMNYRQQGQQYSIRVEYESYQDETQPNSVLRWDQIFNIPIGDVRKPISITLVPLSKFGNVQEGYIQLALDNYRDQVSHKEEIAFQDKLNRMMEWRLRFQIEWIYSDVDFYNQKIKEQKGRIDEEEEIIQSIQKNLSNIHSLLRGLHKEEAVVLDRPAITPKDKLEKMYGYTIYALYLFIACQAYISFERCNFLDLNLKVSIVFCLMVDLISRDFEGIRFLTYLVVLLFSIIYDLLWFIVNDFDNYVGGTYFMDENAEISAKAVVYILVIFMLLVKIILGVLLNQLYRELQA